MVCCVKVVAWFRVEFNGQTASLERGFLLAKWRIKHGYVSWNASSADEAIQVKCVDGKSIAENITLRLTVSVVAL